jgi:hypothetical protein
MIANTVVSPSESIGTIRAKPVRERAERDILISALWITGSPSATRPRTASA